jgi:hypothetical protein
MGVAVVEAGDGTAAAARRKGKVLGCREGKVRHGSRLRSLKVVGVGKR